MTSWRDDLPPIPGERIIDGVVQEGRRRVRRNERQRRALTFGGIGVAAAAVVVVVTSSLVGRPSSDDDQATSGTVMPAEWAWAGTTPPVGDTAVPPVSGEVVVPADVFFALSEVWELPPTGPACGPTEFVVTYEPVGSTVSSVTVRWSVAAASGESPMVVVDGVATATIGPFPPETLVDSNDVEIVVFVIDDGPGTFHMSRSDGTVVLRDCPG